MNNQHNLTEGEWRIGVKLATGLTDDQINRSLNLAGVNFADHGLKRCESAVLHYGKQIADREGTLLPDWFSLIYRR